MCYKLVLSYGVFCSVLNARKSKLQRFVFGCGIRIGIKVISEI